MKAVIIIALLVFSVIGLYKIIKSSYKGISGHNILIKGGSGSGKTTTLVYLSLKLYFRNCFLWWINRYIIYYIKFFFIFMFSNKKKLKYKIDNLKYSYCCDKPLLVSNFPIYWGKKFLSVKFDDIIFKCRCYLPENSIVCISEMQNICNQYFYKDEYLSTLYVKWFTQHRHFDNSYFLCDSQSLDNLFNGITRSSSQVITCMGIKRFLFIKYCSVYVDNTGLGLNDFTNDILFSVYYFLINPFKHFNSRFNKFLISGNHEIIFNSEKHNSVYNCGDIQ